MLNTRIKSKQNGELERLEEQLRLGDSKRLKEYLQCEFPTRMRTLCVTQVREGVPGAKLLLRLEEASGRKGQAEAAMRPLGSRQAVPGLGAGEGTWLYS